MATTTRRFQERSGLFRDDCPHVAGRLSAIVGWRSVGFVNWGFEPEHVAPLLPSHLHVDLYGGQAWVGYQFVTTTPRPGSPLMRLPSRLAERALANEARLRVCVVDKFGLPGVYYLSVDVDRSPMARALRRWFNLNVYDATTQFEVDGSRADYRCQRSDGSRSGVALHISSDRAATDIDRFLTARWRLLLPSRFWRDVGETRWLIAAHEPWALQRASILSADADALVAAGLPEPVGNPVAAWSSGVDVRLSIARS